MGCSHCKVWLKQDCKRKFWGERSPNKPLKIELAPLVKRKQMNGLVGDFYGLHKLEDNGISKRLREVRLLKQIFNKYYLRLYLYRNLIEEECLKQNQKPTWLTTIAMATARLYGSLSYVL